MNWKNILRLRAMGMILVLALILIPVGYLAAADGGNLGVHLTDPIKVDGGYISGTMFGDIGKEVRVYRGIPYAAPPVGDLRWKPPQPVIPWEGIRESTKLGPWAAQPYPSTPVFEVMQESGMSEDCLHLNVLTPAQKTSDRLPVLVWIHGGRLDILSGNQLHYNTPQLPQHGAVVVTISHRLGPLGYFAHPLLTAESNGHGSGNYAQLDLIVALQWIKRNIASFGGDPNNLTIFGQSGGGRKVNWLMASPIVPKGLFQRAWSQSGSIESITLAEAEANGVKLAKKLMNDQPYTLADLRAKSWQDIINAGLAVKYSAQFVEDGWSLKEPITATFQAGKQQDVPYMIGMVGTEDAGHFYMPVELVPAIKQLTSSIFAYVFHGVPAGWRSLGATGWHSIDVNYVFGSLDSLEHISPTYLAYYIKPQCPSCTLDPGITETDEWLAEFMKEMLVQFAETGNPSIKGVVTWPPYNPKSDLYLDIDVPLQVKSGFSTLSQ